LRALEMGYSKLVVVVSVLVPFFA